ncbi:hypothetical protein ACLB2K_030660 [Fragaria x ananassa]
MRVPEDKHAAIIEELCGVILLAVPGFPIRMRLMYVTRQVALEGLEMVRVDSLEEASVRDTPCAICMEDIDHFRGIEKDEQTIIRLPYLHLYHGDYIVPWPHRRQALFQYSMVPATKSSSRSSARPRWPMLLIMSSGGLITATLLCRLLKRA